MSGVTVDSLALCQVAVVLPSQEVVSITSHDAFYISIPWLVMG